MKTHIDSLMDVVEDATNAINNYNGNKVITLKDGSKAIDHDDAYIVIGMAEPLVRDKRNQRIFDKGVITKEELAERDVYLADTMDYFDICELADMLNA